MPYSKHRYIAILDHWGRWFPDSLRTIITTDKICTGTLALQFTPLQIQKDMRRVRGVWVFCGYYFVFHADRWYKQREPSWSLSHTFEGIWWPRGQTGFFTFGFNTPYGSGVSQTPIFFAKHPFPTGYPLQGLVTYVETTEGQPPLSHLLIKTTVLVAAG